uniref:Uncharacterized protein n=1 Tax=Knipowitschia caucasica TaxID=637954 RepID=A0AAV2J9J7_KNICA
MSPPSHRHPRSLCSEESALLQGVALGEAVCQATGRRDMYQHKVRNNKWGAAAVITDVFGERRPKRQVWPDSFHNKNAVCDITTSRGDDKAPAGLHFGPDHALHRKRKMKRVTREQCDDGPLLEEQETEGQRQLHSLLLQQLQTTVDIQQCVSKRKCFAPAALYCPFGEQAAGVRSLSQFQTLQDGDKQLSALRDLGLAPDEISLWTSRDSPHTDKSRGVVAEPGATEQRLQQIQEKMASHTELLMRPQRFSFSRGLSRREMEVEQSLYHGSQQPGYLCALYHRDHKDAEHQVATASRTIDSVYREVLAEETTKLSKPKKQKQKLKIVPEPTELDQSQTPDTHHQAPSGQSEESRPQEPLRLAEETEIDLKQPISSLRAQSHGALTVTGLVPVVSDEDIAANCESDENIRSIPRFRNYEPGKPSKFFSLTELSGHKCMACSDNQCSSERSVFCTEDAPFCFSRTESYGSGYTNIQKGCVQSNICPATVENQVVSFQVGNNSYIRNTTCCDTDNCNVATQTIMIPAGSLQCYTCDLYSHECNVDTVTCNELEVCAMTRENSSPRIYGCVSENLCNNATMTQQHFGYYEELSCCDTDFCNNLNKTGCEDKDDWSVFCSAGPMLSLSVPLCLLGLFTRTF